MQIFNPADKVIMQLLGEQRRKDDKEIRPMKYTLRLREEEGFILHNFLTGESIFFKDDKDLRACRDYLFARYFFVHEDNDDYKLTTELRAALRLVNQKKEITSYKILTTTDCNARCSYCYELGMKRIDMTADIADSVVKYIIKKSGNKKITLAWFGGEPLLNTKVIDYICMKLKQEQKEFSSVMTSNGYLFTPELADKAADIWNLKNIQITLDGTADNYNKIKAYANVNDNPFVRVTENIGDLIRKGIRVNVRLNVSLDNYEDMFKLADFLDSNYPDKEYLSVYASGLFQDTEGTDEIKKDKLYNCLDNLTKYLYSKGLAKRSRRSLKLRASGCMADNDSHRGISPTGMLMKCEHHIFTRLMGNIKDGCENAAVAKEWKEKLPYGDTCEDCVALPLCYRLKNCPVSHVCTQDERNQYTEDLSFALSSMFSEWKSKNIYLETEYKQV